MANHKSALKRIRSNDKKRVLNKYYKRTTSNAIRKIRTTKDKKEALEQLPVVFSMLDRLAKKHTIHKNKVGNIKSKLNIMVNKMP